MAQSRKGNANPNSNIFGAIPPAALILGFAGLIPFVLLSGWMVFGQETLISQVHNALLIYAIAILSFMGGIHWGIAMTGEYSVSHDRSNKGFVSSVVPALAAWLAWFFPLKFQFAWLALCFIALLAYDLHVSKRGEAPDWYPSLRWSLTLVVCLCLGGAGFMSFR